MQKGFCNSIGHNQTHAPQQIRRDSTEINPQSSVAALGALLVEDAMHISNPIHRAWSALAAFVLITAPAQGMTLEQLNGKRITFSVSYNMSGRNAHGEFTGAVSTTVGQIQISGNSVSGSATRTVTYQGKTLGSQSGTVSGAIGKPQQGTFGGNYVWLLDGNSLVHLRTVKVGGLKITINFTGSGCSVRAPIMHEVGAGETTSQSVFGGDVVVHSVSKASTSCSMGG
jgi:hypothetical protein